ncbi:SynChlorMet cassette protein ScmD, partial [Fibrobacterota bacterium]
NPLIVLREEFDDWAILFNPDTGEGHGINPVSVSIWKQLDGRQTIPEIAGDLRNNFNNVPGNAEDFVREFVKDLIEKGLAGYEQTQV